MELRLSSLPPILKAIWAVTIASMFWVRKPSRHDETFSEGRTKRERIFRLQTLLAPSPQLPLILKCTHAAFSISCFVPNLFSNILNPYPGILPLPGWFYFDRLLILWVFISSKTVS